MYELLSQHVAEVNRNYEYFVRTKQKETVMDYQGYTTFKAETNEAVLTVTFD